jgi:hypothetical protein
MILSLNSRYVQQKRCNPPQLAIKAAQFFNKAIADPTPSAILKSEKTFENSGCLAIASLPLSSSRDRVATSWFHLPL